MPLPIFNRFTTSPNRKYRFAEPQNPMTPMDAWVEGLGIDPNAQAQWTKALTSLGQMANDRTNQTYDVASDTLEGGYQRQTPAGSGTGIPMRAEEPIDTTEPPPLGNNPNQVTPTYQSEQPVTTTEPQVETQAVAERPYEPMPEVGQAPGMGISKTVPKDEYEVSGTTPSETPQTTPSTEQKKRGSQQTLAEIEALNKAPLERRKSIWKRIGTGIKDGVMNWVEEGMPGGIFGILGAAGFGGIASAASPNFNAEQSVGRKKSGLMRRYGAQTEQEALDQKYRLGEEQINTIGRDDETNRAKAKAQQDAVIQRANKAEIDSLNRQYNSLPKYDENDPDDRAFGDAFQKTFGYRPPSKNAKTKSEQVIDNRDGQVYLLQTDEQGNEKVIRLTKDDGSPFKVESNQMLASSDREKQRMLQEKLQHSRNITALKVAEINYKGRVDTANITQTGANSRFDKRIQNEKDEFARLMKLREEAATNKNDNEILRLDAIIKQGKANAVARGLTQEQINEIFGEN